MADIETTTDLQERAETTQSEAAPQADTQPAEPAADQPPQPEAKPEAEDDKKDPPAAEDQPEDQEAEKPEEPKPEDPKPEEPKSEEGKAPDTAELTARLVDAELRAAAAAANIRADRIPYAVRLADKAKAEGAPDLTAYAADQIAQIVKDLPELVTAVGGTGSAGDFARKPSAKKDAFQQGLEG